MPGQPSNVVERVSLLAEAIAELCGVGWEPRPYTTEAVFDLIDSGSAVTANDVTDAEVGDALTFTQADAARWLEARREPHHPHWVRTDIEDRSHVRGRYSDRPRLIKRQVAVERTTEAFRGAVRVAGGWETLVRWTLFYGPSRPMVY